jgi:hypothetical protein
MGVSSVQKRFGIIVSSEMMHFPRCTDRTWFMPLMLWVKSSALQQDCKFIQRMFFYFSTFAYAVVNIRQTPLDIVT